MPYKVVGSDVYHKKGGKWSIKQHCTSPQNAHIVKANLDKRDRGEATGWEKRMNRWKK